MIKALIFDFDGLILDTEVPAFEAWKEIYHAYGFDLELSTWVSCIGTSGGFDPYGDLRRRVGRTINIEAISEKRRALSAPRVERQPLLPGVEDRIIEAKRLGLKLGVASNSSDAWVTGHLGRLGLEHHFDAFSFGNWVARSKPDPEIYEAILNKLEIRGDQGLALEDSPNGILSAKRAGLFCVAVPNLLTKGLDLSEADLKLNSLADLSLEEIRERLRKRAIPRKIAPAGSRISI